jgi:hypothetical protein
MLRTCKVICVTTLINDTLVEGQIYQVEAPPMDKTKWIVISEGNVWTYHERWQFEHIITHYAIHPKAYGELQLPIVAREMNMNVVVTPAGYISQVHDGDIEVHAYKNEQRIGCGDVRFL